ncbi:acetyltransferase component of pyruvate dehydrogenase complex [Oxalicibacterium flavum]|uniref:Dihydrolipoamide acetyltransferase component of pyruvate dehydrogenase complex n=1 Tax=Oxalicibacterium flavum TaxID=179467 RepID=A0A8J2ULA4_9BURK|nr:dihydrolipoyllysine-residue acetyltransferase [Oxalicibacterium flavum]GGC09363.1 acetyltransferase component of pyruvate dehydrogenase complex [Oxalicibacterium flavum]
MSMVEIKVPDIGDFKDVEIIEVLVQPGDKVTVDQSLITVESDKASMEIPSSHAGVVKELKVKLGDKISEGSLVLTLEAEEAAPKAEEAKQAVKEEPAPAAPEPAAPKAEAPKQEEAPKPAPQPEAPKAAAAAPAAAASASHAPATRADSKAHASPSIRKFARELGVDLGKVNGTGPKGRITQEDVQSFVKSALSAAPVAAPAAAPAAKADGGGLGLLPWPSLDFSKFGPTTIEPLSRIKKISGPNLHRNWVMIPHVTQYDETDVTELEALRKESNEKLGKTGVKLTLLAFVIKACVAALKKHPEFNSSLDENGENLILKQYYNIGFAADTPHGLVVPVVKDADKKSVTEIAKEMGELSAQAREGKLKGADMQGATFTISSLGGIGGTYFTPLINAPEVAIVGLSKTQMKPIWNGKEFVPRLIMPLSLSYDHRVIDGAQGARFVTYLSEVLADLRKSLI